MWNSQFSNSRCNEMEKIKEQKMHLERLITSKSTMSMEEPMKPSFLYTRSKKEQIEKEKRTKIDYENGVLVKKIVEITNKPSPYNIERCRIPRCPAFDKNTYAYVKNKKKYDIDVDNLKLYKRLVSAKPYYRTHEVVKDHVKSKYLQSQISQTKSK